MGFGVGLGITVFSFPLMLLMIFITLRHNKKIDARKAAGEELDDQVDYKYVI